MILKPVVIDNWYTKEELKKVYKEIDFYSDKDKLVTQHGNVATEHGKDQADCFRVHLSTVYNIEGKKLSDILMLMDKMRQKTFHDHITKTCKIYRGFKNTNTDASMIAYYENSQYYEPHTDSAKYSILIWINKEPKKFTGGDLILPDLKQKIECKNNRLVLFPGYLYHEVTEVKMKGKYKIGDGRWCIVHFFDH
tara:strand:- start:1081 stop:1662 length:582 start_codon:yes stop_codon:yes gene_type:complete